MNLWLDDIRAAPEGWTWVQSVEECIQKLATGEVEMLSLDNDLGWVIDDAYIYQGARALAPEGYKVVEWMVENNVWPEFVSVHSSNVIAKQRMQDMIETFGNYNKRQQITFTVQAHKRRHNQTYPAVAYERVKNG